MSEIRQDVTTKEWVIIAPERGKRPSQRPQKKVETRELPVRDPDCPFCPGNEGNTPGDVLRIPADKGKDWQVRVVPNRFAALTPDQSVNRVEDGRFFRKMGGFGVHEVIIESPVHNTSPALMTYDHLEKVLSAYRERYNALKKDPRIKCITIFKNHGWTAGTSLVHPHSQLVATPVMAPYYNRKFDVAHDYYADRGRCLYCDLIAWDLEHAHDRVVADTEEFLVVQPYASHVSYETWILPRRHHASFGIYPESLLGEMALVLKDTLFCLYRGLDNPSYNMMIDSTSTEDEDDPYYHWHIRIMPRLNTIAGFEIGSGIYISTALPEDTAAVLRRIATTCAEVTCPAFKDEPSESAGPTAAPAGG
ncbi:MAG: galactose-1-phosphate uridylyltransferase [Chloroflexota bacterium]